MLNLHQLHLFITVVELGGFTAAAEKLHISQSSVSIQVRRLEQNFGVDLFERNGRNLKLTEIGKELYQYSCKITNLAKETEQAIESYKGLEKGTVRVGASTTPGNYLLPAVAANFRRQYPGLKVEVSIGNTREIEQKILLNAIDLALLGEEKTYDESLVIEPLVQDKLVVVCGKDHHLAYSGKISLRELASQKFVLREKGSSTRDMVDKILKEARIALNDVWELSRTESIKQIIMANWGLSILSYSSVKLEVEAGHLKIVSLQESSFSTFQKVFSTY
ncbi:MAG: LysR family transcriptional regulator [Bacillota bacterium]|nr:LysR family transcriptional regulator [Bacillota bacterium]